MEQIYGMLELRQYSMYCTSLLRNRGFKLQQKSREYVEHGQMSDALEQKSNIILKDWAYFHILIS